LPELVGEAVEFAVRKREVSDRIDSRAREKLRDTLDLLLWHLAEKLIFQTRALDDFLASEASELDPEARAILREALTYVNVSLDLGFQATREADEQISRIAEALA